MNKILITALCLTVSGCSVERNAGPEQPFEADARPRNPDHFILGNGSQIPTPYSEVNSLAVSTGQTGMMNYDFHDWLRPYGTIQVAETNDHEGTRYRIELEGLVPNGFYTAWLVRVRGSNRGDKRDLALGVPYDGPAAEVEGTNTVLADDNGNVVHEVTMTTTQMDASGTTYFGHEFWDEIHIAFHGDSHAYGFVPGPNHWTQVVLPIRPFDGSGQAALTFQPADDFAGLVADSGDLMDDYTEAQWDTASGRVTFNHVNLATTQEVAVLLTADGLVPNGHYSAWLEKRGARCALGAQTASTGPREVFDNNLAVDDEGRGEVRAVLADTSCGGEFGEIEDWDRVVVRFHPRDLEAPDDATVHLSAGVPSGF